MTGRQEHLDGRAVVILLACCAFWGVQQVLVKATLPELAPVFQAASSESILTKQPDMSACQRTPSKTKNSGSGPK